MNLLGVWRSVRAALPEIARRQGHVVVVSSIYAFFNGVGAAPYAMAKAGVEQLGRALRVELKPHGASASVAYFGFIDTEMVHQAIDADPLADRMIGRCAEGPPQAPAAVGRGRGDRARHRAPPAADHPPAPLDGALASCAGILNPLLDAQMERDAETQAITRELDARAGERTPTTAGAGS